MSGGFEEILGGLYGAVSRETVDKLKAEHQDVTNQILSKLNMARQKANRLADRLIAADERYQLLLAENAELKRRLRDAEA